MRHADRAASWADHAVENSKKCIPGLKKSENHFLRKYLEMCFFCMKTSFFGIFRFLKMWKNIFRIFRETPAGAARSGPGRKCRKWRGRPLFYKQNSRIRAVKSLYRAGPDLQIFMWDFREKLARNRIRRVVGELGGNFPSAPICLRKLFFFSRGIFYRNR